MKEIKLSFAQLMALSAILLLFGCGGGDSSEDPPVDITMSPAKVLGTLPINGEPCVEYEEVENDEAQVLVHFEWNAAQFAQSYILVISEGTNEIFRNSFNTLSTEVVLIRGKTYTWHVMSVNKDRETKGDTFSFTTPGIPVGNYAPYAADISIEFDSDTFEMQVSWVGSDEDGDSLRYDVIVLESESLLIEYSGLDTTEIAPFTFIPSTSYQIEVASIDNNENFSISTLNIVSPD